MINLLSPKEKEKIYLDQTRKLIRILGSAILIMIICLALVLFYINFYISEKYVSQKAVLEKTENQYKTDDFLKYKNILQDYNKSIGQLKYFYKEEIGFQSAFKSILEIERPEGIYFSNLSLDRGKDNNRIEVKISGSSNTRDSLLIFKKNIEKKPEIKNANFSAESWINPGNANFYLTFDIYGS